jgi:hypothetical protein
MIIHSKTFKFSSLPTELRLMVWNQTFEPRILHLTSQTIGLTDPDGVRMTHLHFKLREKPPVALWICNESRTLALKHYTPSFHPTTLPLERASEINAFYFNPELDTVHIVNNKFCSELWTLSRKIRRETIQSIKTLVIGSQRIQQNLWTTKWIIFVAGKLPTFESLETLILAVEGLPRDEEEWIRENMEDHLIKVKNSPALYMWGVRQKWKLPVVKVMNPQTLDSQLWL